MNYQIEFKPRAVKDLKALSAVQHRQVVEKIEALQKDLVGSVMSKNSPIIPRNIGCALAITASCSRWMGIPSSCIVYCIAKMLINSWRNSC